MSVGEALILGVVEGITEFLPISSTGHMIIVSHLLKMPQTEFLKTFEIAIQLGAIGAVLVLYGRVFLSGQGIARKALAAFVPTAVIGYIFYKTVKEFLLGNIVVVAWALLLGGVSLIVFELAGRRRKEEGLQLEHITYPQAIIIGLCQSLAIVPGVSRSAATIMGGLMLGISRRAITEFSFLLAVPTMMAATGLDIVKSSASIIAANAGTLAIGFGVAFVVALATIKVLIHYVQRHDFIVFGFYRIAVGIVLLLYFQPA